MTKVLAITQARSGSTRLPAKVFKSIGNHTLLGLHVERAKRAKLIDELVIATTDKPDDDAIEEFAKKIGCPCSRGSEDNVLDRFYQAALPCQPDYIVRITSDCPLLDPVLIDAIIEKTISSDIDYCSNTLVEAYPDGQDIEVCTFAALEKAWKQAELKSDKEHVTPFIKRNSDFSGGNLFRAINYPAPENYNHVRLCVDEPIDLEVIRQLVDLHGIDADWMTYTKAYLSNDKIRGLNESIIRNEGYLKSIEEDKR